MRCEEAIVDCRDNGEEGDRAASGRKGGGGGGVGAVRTVRDSEGCCESFPDAGYVEGEHEFDGGPGKERSKERIHGTVDVMEGERVEDMVAGRVVPGLVQRPSLSSKDRLGEDNAFLRVFSCAGLEGRLM